MSKTFEITRRTMLQGLGTAIALPLLDGMLPGLSLTGSVRAAANGAAAPLRMAFMYVPNGVHMQDWTPATEGAEFVLPATLEPLQSVKSDLCVLTGLTHKKAEANGDGGGDHARALTTFLTGTQAKKTHGADIRAGVSADQVAAGEIGRQTRFASLEIGCDGGAQSGNCDSGYSCAYSSNIAWKNETSPLVKENNPRLVFERLFTSGRPGESSQARAKRERYNKSVLDFVLDDAQRLRTRLGATDQRKLDEYLSAVRELERRIATAQKPSESGSAASPLGRPVPKGIPDDYGEHIRLMGDLMALAFQTDTTRISTCVIANEGSNRSYPFIEVPEGHHDLSHHGNDEKKHEKIKKINRFHIVQFAYLIEKLKAIPEGDGTLLDHCMIVYGSGIGDGNAHNHDNLPILLAGKGSGTIQSGRHVKFDNGTPLTNLFLSMLDRLNVRCDRLGDSTGRLKGLEG
ncbi:MAG: DUF1552 domain-containing protein [Planctomycetaceae bacterium]|nr:DUF1552 domain-containing protein [Planctomycetaceae bacterium]